MADCENCTNECKENIPNTIPYIVYETEMARNERHTKRWIVAFFVALAMLFVTNIGWLIYESQFETISYAQDGEGVNIIGDENEVAPDGAKTDVQTEEK